MKGSDNSTGTRTIENCPSDKYLELCARHLKGTITVEEMSDLERHAASCRTCLHDIEDTRRYEGLAATSDQKRIDELVHRSPGLVSLITLYIQDSTIPSRLVTLPAKVAEHLQRCEPCLSLYESISLKRREVVLDYLTKRPNPQ